MSTPPHNPKRRSFRRATTRRAQNFGDACDQARNDGLCRRIVGRQRRMWLLAYEGEEHDRHHEIPGSQIDERPAPSCLRIGEEATHQLPRHIFRQRVG
jgi:hypothetical protein